VYNDEFKETVIILKSSFSFITFFNSNKVKVIFEVQFNEVFNTRQLVLQLLD